MGKRWAQAKSHGLMRLVSMVVCLLLAKSGMAQSILVAFCYLGCDNEPLHRPCWADSAPLNHAITFPIPLLLLHHPLMPKVQTE